MINEKYVPLQCDIRIHHYDKPYFEVEKGYQYVMSTHKKQIQNLPKAEKPLEVTPYYVITKVDPAIDKYAEAPFFKEKLARANERLAKVGFPPLMTNN